MKVLVTGREGQLSRTILESCADLPWLRLERLGRPQLDLEVAGSASAAVRRLRPDVIINAAAYTAVEQAEDEPERAFRVNGAGAGELAEAARALGARIIQISTDYVFDGHSTEAYRPDDAPNPLNVYGRSKLAGEERVRAANPDHLVLRTAWLFSRFPDNFISTMLRLAEQQQAIRVVADQWGSPTSAAAVAAGLRAILFDWRDGGKQGLGSTQHLAGTGAASWADLAEAAFVQSGALGGPTAEVERISSARRPSRARRPTRSVLDSSTFVSAFGIGTEPWRDALVPVISRLAGGSAEGQ